LGVFFSSPLLLEAESDFEHPNSFIGNAGWSEGLELWIEVGEVSVGDGLPLRLRFANDVTRKNSLFGDHWWYLGDVLDRVTKLSRDFCCGPLASPLLPNAPVLEKLEPLQKTPP